MSTRQAVRAGMFYKASGQACRAEATALLNAAKMPEDLPVRLYGGLVPHAGWAYSGALAAMTFKALLTPRPSVHPHQPGTIVLFGADHTGVVQLGEVWDKGAWQSPLGEMNIDETLSSGLIDACDELRSNPQAHVQEHSLEVQIPLIKVAAPTAKIVPIAVPPAEVAVEIGRIVGKYLSERAGDVCVIGSTDLTHHGGHFGSPGGSGEQSEAYARQNDSRMLNLIEKLYAEAIVPEAHQRGNACGAGAIAATISAVRELGAKKGKVLSYTNSYEVTHEKYPYELDDTTVGYASVVFA